MRIHEFIWSADRVDHVARHRVQPEEVEEVCFGHAMVQRATSRGRQKLPITDSIEELARFWDTHDLTDFEEELEEAAEPVFVRPKGISLSIDLQVAEAQHLKKIAQSRGVTETTVVRQWILERLQESSRSSRGPDKRMRPARQTRARG